MSSRDSVLASVRRHQPEAEPHPGLEGDWIRYNDPVEQFRSVLSSVGGESHVVPTLDDVRAVLGERESFTSAARTCSFLSEMAGSVDADAVADPREFADLDVLVFGGELAVAENAAIWIDAHPRQRAAYFLAQHLVGIVPRDGIVHNMHEAYDRLLPEGSGNGHPSPFATPGFGVFLSGPSKTADIEQSLVIGAHGARSLIVFVVDG